MTTSNTTELTKEQKCITYLFERMHNNILINTDKGNDIEEKIKQTPEICHHFLVVFRKVAELPHIANDKVILSHLEKLCGAKTFMEAVEYYENSNKEALAIYNLSKM